MNTKTKGLDDFVANLRRQLETEGAGLPQASHRLEPGFEAPSRGSREPPPPAAHLAPGS